MPSPRTIYIRELAPYHAEQWFNGLFEAIKSLADMPGRCPLIPEADHFDQPVRHLLYGRRSGIYRIIFDIDENAEDGPVVRVLRIQHGARDVISLDDIGE